MTDIQIAQNTKMDNIINILNKLNIKEEDYENDNIIGLF